MYVKQLSLRNFKSFKQGELELVKGFNSFIGPNGSGKSNLVDALLFAFGESSLRSMRVKKTPDLIFGSSSQAAEVTLLLEDGDKHHEIKRLVRKDGDTKYSLDGKRVKKYVLEEFLAKHRLYTTNIIKQGEVQRIVEMNPKDRRTLVDAVANVSEYEQKKKEAMNELGKVDDKLKSGQTILSERAGYLQELAGEKADAEKYLELKKEHDEAKASLIYIDLKTFNNEFESIVASMSQQQGTLDGVKRQIDELARQVSEQAAERQKVHEKIMKRSEGKQLILQREIDELNGKVERSRAIIEEKQSAITKEEARMNSLKLESTKASDESRGAKNQLKKAQEELDEVAAILKTEHDKLDALIRQSDAFSQDFFNARKVAEDAANEILACKEKLNALQAEVGKQQEIKKLKLAELDRLSTGKFAEFEEKKKAIRERLAVAKQKANASDAELREIMDEEKKLNKDLTVTEEALLQARTKAVELSSRLRTIRDGDTSRALSAVLEMREGGKEKGIYGTVEELCTYEAEYALPIQVALGSRSNYVIVDSVKTASKAIEYLRTNKLGRVSFIPLDKINTQVPNSEEAKIAKTKGMGFIIDYVEFDPAYRRAFEYALGTTILTESLKTSETLIGKARLVTMDGQLAESSGLMTGGSGQVKFNAAKEKKELEELEAKVQLHTKAKDAALSALYSLRDRLNEARKNKAGTDIEAKACEIELKSIEEQENAESDKKANLRNTIKQLKDEATACDEAIRKADEERSELIRSISDLNIKALEAKEKIDVEKEKKFGMTVKEMEHKVGELRVKVSECTNNVTSLRTQATVYEKQFEAVEKQLKEALRDQQEAQEAIKQNDVLIKQSLKLLDEKQAEQRTLSSALKELYDARDAVEAQIQKLGNEKGKLEFERDKLEREMNSRNVRRAVVETTLKNLQAEFAAFENVEIHEQEKLSEQLKPELIAKNRQLQEAIEALGAVNLKAIELYAQRAGELEEQKQRVAQLASEKDAVIRLIDEIEGKKINTFMQTFNHVNANFKRLFSFIFAGKGELFLDNTENPFLGGLTIKVQLENKEVKYLEIMSGGEKSLIALMFIFALQAFNPAGVYILDEADAALDQENSRKLSELINQLSRDSQFIVVSHNQNVFKRAQCLAGVTMTPQGSAIVEVKVGEANSAQNTAKTN